MKRAVKYTLMIYGIISLCISCLFSKSVYADNYPTRYYVDFNYVKESWNVLTEYDKEYTIDDLTAFIYYADLDAYIDQGTEGATDNVDSNFPAFVVADSTYHSNSNAIPMNRKCLEFSELSSIWVNTNGATGNVYANNIIDWLMDLNPLSTYDSGSSYIRYEVLYKLGYRITGYCQTQSTTGTTVYLYTLQKLTGSEHINFYGDTSLDAYITYSSMHDNYMFMAFQKYSFDITTVNVHNSNPAQYLNFDPNADVITVTLSDMLLEETGHDSSWYPDTLYWTIYSIQDMVLITYGSANGTNGEEYKTYTFHITGRAPTVTFSRLYGLYDNVGNVYNVLTPTRTRGRLYDMEYLKGAGSDLTSINQHLVTIEDLLEDFQVTEINNIYQDITNEYDVDIDLTINNVIDDLKLHINDFDFTDEDYQIPETDLQKISGFRLIFTNMIQTMNANGIGILWFLPLVLLVLGAII